MNRKKLEQAVDDMAGQISHMALDIIILKYRERWGLDASPEFVQRTLDSRAKYLLQYDAWFSLVDEEIEAHPPAVSGASTAH